MSLLSTESFMAFAQWTGDDAYNTTNNNMRKAFAAAFKRAGYFSYAMDQSTYQDSGAWIVRPDPVYPDRQALVYSSGNTANANRGGAYVVGASIRKNVPSQGRPVIGGFSLYVPPEYVPNAYNVSAVNVLNVYATLAADTGNVGTAVTTMFNVMSDLAIANASGVKQSTKTLVPGRLAYIEYRIADNEVRVWIDDVLVMQSAVSPAVESIGFTVFQNNVTAPATFMQGAPGRWAISNWYNLVEDAQAPNVRLGPTTRISGVRPNNDVDVDFVRPVDAPSNAAVAAQDLVDAPTWTLQSSNAGDMDIYSTNKDTAASSGKLVHAVVTKVLASNLESNPHTLRALVVSQGGVEKEDPKPRQFVQLATLPNAKTMYNIQRRPTDGKVFSAGIGPILVASGPAADANTTWSLISDEGTAVWGLVCFRSDGTGIIVRSDYKVQIIPPGSDTPGAAIAVSAVSSYQPQCTLVLPDNTILIGAANGRIWRCAGDKDPSVPANWTLVVPTTAAFGSLVYHPGLGRIVGAAAATSVYTSDDKGLTWTARPTGIATSMSESVTANQMAFDGTWFTIMVQNTTSANYIRRSQDGISWSSPTYNTNASPQFVLNYAFGDAISGTMLFTSGKNTTLTSSDGGANFRRQPLFPDSLFGTCVLPNGDWFMCGANGLLMAYTSALIDAPLTPLAGYVLAYNVATTNPDTGAAWTPAEAAAAKFGMRVTS
jgi:hypothetical protein